ncbi:endonuclease domain-containing protein [Bradyrhizobium sp.]|uniref:endonuclease domain-containing protein n=1 Tax=Bradyrhizobium sp. TaxID=376 RepID=UPI003C250681
MSKGLGPFKARARQSRAAQSNAEARLWQALRGRRLARYKFRRQHPVDRYIVDFVALDSKLIIEVDGATHSTDAELEHDSQRTRVLESFGFHVVEGQQSRYLQQSRGRVGNDLQHLGDQ